MGRTNLLGNERGTAVILVAAAMTILMGMCALVIDVGIVYVQKIKLQNAIDAASLAGAQELPDTSKALDVANQCIQLNGFNTSDVDITFPDSQTINITGNKRVNYVFAKALGFDSVDVNNTAAAQRAGMGGPFNYVIFSGSETQTLALNGSSYNIAGSTHANSHFSVNGSSLTIAGACEASQTITINGSHINIPNRIPNAPKIEMPDFSETIRLQAESGGQVYNGDKTFNGSSIDVTHPIYVKGNITINGSDFTGVGCIFATGSITFNGSSQNVSTKDAVCIYSKTGNITINGSSQTVDGILYAPGGSIIMNGSSQTVNGRVIGNTISINGSSINIIGGTNELKSLPSGGVKLVR